jgi:TonB-linked SusC/RagA family outer membrane protein
MRMIKEQTQSQHKANKTIMFSNKNTKSFAVTRFKGMTVLALFLLMTVTAPLQVIYAVQDNDRSLSALAQQIVVERSDEVMTISLDINEMKLSEALEILTSEMGVGLSYSSDTPLDKIVTLQLSDVPFHEALYALLEGTDLEPLLPPTKDVLVISEKEEDAETEIYQETVTGTVVDSQTGEALPGVNIVIQGTSSGTATNIDGEFELSVPSLDVTVVASYIGYQTQDIAVEGRTDLNIVMVSEAIAGDEIVVVGYGARQRSDITGSVSSINRNDLNEVPLVTSPQQMLQGRAAGVDVVSTGNKPGDGVSVRIRGRRSFNAGNDPLYVIDGIPVSGGFNEINPADIESINILKDASATAIYGSRGANGVVIITTKRGEPGRVNVSFDSYVGFSEIYRTSPIMSGPEFAEFFRETRRATGDYDDSDPNADQSIFEEVELEGIALGRTTDYYGMLIQNGFNQNHNLSVSGGSEDTRYNISVGYFEDIGIVPNQNYNRYNARINIDQNISDRIRVGTSILGSISERNGENWNALSTAIGENPLGVPYDENGELLLRTTSDPLTINVLLDLEPGAVINKRNTTRLFGNLYGEVEFLDGLNFRMNFGPDISHGKLGDFRAARSTAQDGGVSRASINEIDDYNYTWENILTYNTMFSETHGIDVTGLYSIQSIQRETSGLSVNDLPLDNFEYFNVGSAETIQGVESLFRKSTLASYMLRINYSYDNRINVTFTGRADGSSKFSEGNRWGYFPSAAVAWNISNEDFLNNNETITDLRLRLSWGSTGNEGIPPYQTSGLLELTEYDFGGQPAFGYRPSSISNEDMTWESTHSINAGIDFELFAGRVGGSLEFYKSRTTDLLLERQLPTTSGFGSILTNVGVKSNTGIEFTLSTFNIAPQTIGDFSWTTDLNLFTNNEKIVELDQGKVDDVGNHRFIGYPAVVYYDYNKTGIWQLGEEELAEQYSSMVGGVKVEDVNGNGRIDPDDRMILGSDVPDLIGGMTHRFGYKGFDLSVVAYARLGHILESTHHGRATDGRSNLFKHDYWTPDNPTNAYPRPHSGLQQPFFTSTLSYFDGSFVKIRSVNFGYNFSQNFTQRLGIQSLRFYVSVHNPVIFSSYISKHNGDDPENPTRNTPLSRNFLAGWNINF